MKCLSRLKTNNWICHLSWPRQLDPLLCKYNCSFAHFKILFRNQYSVNDQTIKLTRLMNGFNIGKWINEIIMIIPDFTLEIGFSYIGLLPDMSYRFVKAQRDTCKIVLNRSEWKAEEFKQIPYSQFIDDYRSEEIIPFAPVSCTLWIRVPPS